MGERIPQFTLVLAFCHPLKSMLYSHRIIE
jgi:hypothetical protein